MWKRGQASSLGMPYEQEGRKYLRGQALSLGMPQGLEGRKYLLPMAREENILGVRPYR